MKTVIVTIEMDADETQTTNGGIAESLHNYLSIGDGGIVLSVNSVVCRDKRVGPPRGADADRELS